jgi:succinoglycan biosynthesis protein ExoA
MTESFPFITILMPALNEEAYIRESLLSLIGTGYPLDKMEIIVADGGSKDRTLEEIAKVSIDYPFVQVIENPKKFQDTGCNLAAQKANPRSQYYIRVDAHSKWSEGFIPKCIEAAQRTGADLVVFVNAPVGITPFQQALAYALSHPLGVGNSQYRLGKRSGWVDHGQHGCFTREIWEKTGGYLCSEGLRANEDGELSYRVIQAGGKIWLDQELRMTYFPRKDLYSLAKQYFHYGVGRFTNQYLHKSWPSARQLIPPAFLILLFACLSLTLVGISLPLLMLLGTYGALIMLATIQGILTTRDYHLWRLFYIFATIQLSWAVGFLKEALLKSFLEITTKTIKSSGNTKFKSL